MKTLLVLLTLTTPGIAVFCILETILGGATSPLAIVAPPIAGAIAILACSPLMFWLLSRFCKSQDNGEEDR